MKSLTSKDIYQVLRSLPFGETFKVEVTTGSMDPLVSIKDEVVIRRCKFSDISRFDLVAFYSKSLNEVVMHRVVKIERLGLVTKGDSNLKNDLELVTQDTLLGKVVRIENKDIDLEKHNYSLLRWFIDNRIFLRIRGKLLQFFNNTRF